MVGVAIPGKDAASSNDATILPNDIAEVVFRGGVAEAGNNLTASARKTELELPRWALPGHKGLRKKKLDDARSSFSGFDFFPSCLLIFPS